ncbi:MAG: hypothetical protein J6V64_04450 [Burkholderiaceae bacterium]|nr:hypothetical protein [Burkholderiaceae bacterium]
MNQEVCEKEVQEPVEQEVVVKEVVESEKFVQKIVARAQERGLAVVYEMTKKGFVLSLADTDTTVIKVKVIDLEQKLFKLKLISKLTFEHQKFIDLIAKCFGSDEPYVAEMKIKTECVFMKARDFAKMFKAMEKDRLAMQAVIDAGLEELFAEVEIDWENLTEEDQPKIEALGAQLQEEQALELLLQTAAVQMMDNGKLAKLMDRLLPKK